MREKAARSPNPRNNATGKLPTLALAAALALGAAQVRADDGAPVVLANPLAVHSLDELSATRDRPLFTPDRRPPAPPVVARVEPRPVPKPAPPSLVLFGILVDAGQPTAIVRGAPSEKAVRVRVGDQLDGWTIAQIGERQVVLSLDEQSVTFTMFAGKNTSEPAAPVTQHARTARVLELNPAGVLTARRVSKPPP